MFSFRGEARRVQLSLLQCRDLLQGDMRKVVTANQQHRSRDCCKVREQQPAASAATLITTTARTLTCMRRGALLVFLAIATGCQFSENRYLARAVKAEELVGSWRGTDFAIKSLRDVGVTNHLTVEDHTLLLSADGSCSIRTFMKISGSDTADYRTYDSGCRWRLGDAGHQALQFDLTPVPPGGSPYYYFDEKDGRLLLWQYATDPDAWRYMEFEKRTR